MSGKTGYNQFLKAFNLNNQGKNKEALLLVEKYLEVNREDIDAWNLKGHILKDLENSMKNSLISSPSISLTLSSTINGIHQNGL